MNHPLAKLSEDRRKHKMPTSAATSGPRALGRQEVDTVCNFMAMNAATELKGQMAGLCV